MNYDSLDDSERFVHVMRLAGLNISSLIEIVVAGSPVIHMIRDFTKE